MYHSQETSLSKNNGEKQQLKRKTITSFLWKLLELSGYHGVQFVLQIVLARLLTPNDFGAFATLLIVVNIANVLAQSGFGTALVQAKVVNSKDLSTVFWISLFISCVLYCITFVCAGMIEEFFGISDLAIMLRVIALSIIPSSVASVYSASIMRSLNMRKIFVATLSASTVSAVFALAFAVLGLGIWSFILQQIIFVLVSLTVMVVQVRWIPGFEFDFGRAVELFRFGWKILVASLLDVAYQGAYTTAIGRSFGPHQLGLYTQGGKFPQIACTIFDNATRSVLLSTMSRLQNDASQVKQVTRRAMKSSMTLVAPAMIFMVSAGSAIVHVLFGEKWSEAVPFLQILALSFILWPMHSSNLQALNALGKSGKYLQLELVKKAVGALILIVSLLVFQDIIAVAFGRVVGSIASVFINAHPARKLLQYRYRDQIRDVLPPILLSVFAGLLAAPIAYVGWHSLVTLLVQAVVFLCAYLGLGALLKVESLIYLANTTVQMLRSFRKNRITR